MARDTILKVGIKMQMYFLLTNRWALVLAMRNMERASYVLHAITYRFEMVNFHQSTTEEAAKDIAAFVSIFFENFPKFKGRAFHMAGESYGVRSEPAAFSD